MILFWRRNYAKGNLPLNNQNIPVAFSCGKCGSNTLDIPSETDDSCIVTCKSCGTVNGTLGQIKGAAGQAVAETLNEKIKDALREGFKDSKNFRVE